MPLCLALLLGFLAVRTGCSYEPPLVTWTDLSPEKDATTYVNSIPIGNGGLAANVFVDNKNEQDPIMGLLISDQRAWKFQVLNASTDTVLIDIGDPPIRIVAYVDANHDILVVNISSPTKVSATATAELPRPSPSKKKPDFDCVTYDISADFYVSHANDGIIGWAHWNNGTNFVDQTLKQLNLISAASSFMDRPKDRSTVAIWRFSEPVSGVSEGVVRTKAPVHRHTFTSFISVVTIEEGSVSEAIADAEAILNTYAVGPAWERHVAWWRGFWSKSWINISGPNAPLVNEKYALHRYIQATQTRQPLPLKFNGMLFTAQREDPDFRQWGGLNWWQNVRLPYYNMLVAGDFSMQQTLFESYMNTLTGAVAKTTLYYPDMKGPVAFRDEYVHPLIGQTRRFGTTPRTDGITTTSNKTKDIEVMKANLPLMDAVVNFFSQWRTHRDSRGKMVLFPTQSIETWQCPGYKDMVAGTNCSMNDHPTISGLLAVVTRLVKLPSDITQPEQRARWKKLLSILPTVPTTKSKNGGTKLAPCEVCTPTPTNVENADLYAVHPYRYITSKSSEELLSMGRITFSERRFTSDEGWNQNVMDAVLLGLAKEAQSMVVSRAKYPSAKGYRFSVFAPHLQDYPPWADQYAVMNNALTYMLLQPMDDENEGILLFPAWPSWPCHWDVSFKLWGPASTTIRGSLVAGKVTELRVDPEHRLTAVTVRPCQ
ncbi:hypothetical protein FOZ61_010224 [Perkinsus olseni]|uniref:DUF5703 domain-containing protein n=1 Tax=Perkinsus olseni TaxID=32597 RepID=A0A7J6KX95_PEROL|nr:hypothetical protein FOZ61_010224 [Perkinsus olseni]